MKRKLFALSLAVLLPLALLAGSGDVNGDGKVNVADIVEIINYLNGHPSEKFNLAEADVNNDGMVDKADAKLIASKIMGGAPIQISTHEISLYDSSEWQEIEITLNSKSKDALEGVEYQIDYDCAKWIIIRMVDEGVDGDDYIATYKFAITPNISINKRDGVITFHNDELGLNESVVVKTSPYMKTRKKEYHIFNQSYRYLDLHVESSVDILVSGGYIYEVADCEGNWLWTDGYSIQYDCNWTGEDRVANVVVKMVNYPEFTETVRVIQHSATLANTSEVHVITCQPSGGLLEIPIRGNVSVGAKVYYKDASSIYDWETREGEEGEQPSFMHRIDDELRDGNRYIRFNIDANPSIEERLAYLSIGLGDAAEDKFFFVQPGKNAPSFAEQIEALKEFYETTNHAEWNDNTNWMSDKPFNQWFGVNNDIWGSDTIIGDYILKFRLPHNNVIGKLPASISKLMPMTSRSEFTIESNYLFGEIPETVKNHPRWNDIGWDEVIPQENWCPYSGQFRWDSFNLKTEDGSFGYLIEDKTSTVNEVLQRNEYTVVFNAGLICDDPGWWSGISNKRINLFLDYCNKGLGMVAVACGTEGYPWDYGVNYVKTRLNEGMPTGIQWIRNEYGRSAFGSIIPKRLGSTYLLDKEGKLIQIWCSACGNDDWCLEPIADFLKEHIGEPEIHDPFIPNYYTSTDYSQDGVVMTLQTATIGKGVDLVFLGEAYVDTDMELGGLYEQTMYEAMEQFFTEEPYKSMRDRFNVYAVKAVSPNAVHDSGTELAIGGDIEKAFEYAKKAVGDRDDRLMVGVICKPGAISERSCTFMFEGDGSFAAWMFEGVTPVLNHEMGGHGVAFLLDEYVEPGMEDISPNDEAKAALDASYATYGEGANVDWRSDPAEVKWAKFISDPRYSTERIGVYEGSWLYGHGAYRPTENSMMRYNDCGFNAPSREAIYKRVMKLSEGNNWNYDYETFVSFDTPAREAYSKARAKARQTDDEIQQKRIESRPPTIYKGTWRDAGKCEKVEYTSK
jgi:hypothetical protein